MSAERGDFLGTPLDLLTYDQTVARLVELIEQRRFVQHVVINAGKVVLMRDDPGLARIVAACELVSADGQSIVWAGRLLGLQVPERVAGIDLMGSLLEVSEARGYPVYFLGATEEVLDRFVHVVSERHPDLVIAGYHDGYFSDDRALAERVADSGARVLFVGISSPRKEVVLSEQADRLGPLLAVGVGGSFDVWAGMTSRAPAWMQRSGLEWLYRLLQEPRRMWRRYLVGNTRFIAMVVAAKLGLSRSPRR